MLWLKRSMPTLPLNKLEYKDTALSARLSAIAESLSEHSVICDVGSDHGALPLYLLRNGICPKAIVTDLNEKPLERAKKNFAAAGLDHKAQFVLTDGIEEVLAFRPDTFVIAGMGGETILGILERGLGDIPIGTSFILQPMTKIPMLRRFLYKSGFLIRQEKLVYENGKFFVILCAEFDGVSRAEKAVFSDFGEFLPNLHTDCSLAYHSSLLSTLENVIDGRKKAGVSCSDLEANRVFLIKTLEEIHESKRD